MTTAKKIGLFTGLIISIAILLFGNLDPSNAKVTIMAAIAALMAVWWISEAVPLAATSLIPLILFPLFGLLDADEIAGSYINSIIFLFLGGFMIALSMERWGLHKRVALRIITLFGGSPVSIIIGFMIAGASLSMWISNTATTIMMLPIALAIICKMENEFGAKRVHNFSVILLIGIAYSCTIGGLGTLVGTVPNMAFVKILKILFPEAPEIGFGQWMMIGIPISVLMLIVSAFLLTKIYFKVDKALKIDKKFIREEYEKLGPLSFEEKTISIIFALTAFLWIFRSDLNIGLITFPGWSNLLPYSDFVNDGTVAITMAFILFLIPSKKEKTTLLDNKVFSKIPWGIILLFGGGFALANGFSNTGLSIFIGEQLTGMKSLSHIFIILATAATISFLTELTSNTATTQMILPILASVAIAMGMNPLLLMLTATLSASMAFMLPVATPPNTIIFASSRIKVTEMVKTGFALNLLGVIIVSLIVYFVGELVFDLGTFPGWAITE
jgi:sodium-dependent dicarboxylate transporter 2/3/5